MRRLSLGIALAAALSAGAALAQPATPPAIGWPISLEDAKLVAATAQAEAKKRSSIVTVAVVDPAGELVYYEKATGASYITEGAVMKKARSAARNRRPTQYDADRLANGVAILPYVPEMFPFAGGVPILKDGKLIGGIGVSGSPTGDGEIAAAGAKAVK